MRKEKFENKMRKKKLVTQALVTNENVFMPYHEVHKEILDYNENDIPKTVIDSYKEEKTK